jgi:hypothetical protein
MEAAKIISTQMILYNPRQSHIGRLFFIAKHEMPEFLMMIFNRLQILLSASLPEPAGSLPKSTPTVNRCI